MLLMQTQRVLEQAHLGSEQSRLGCHAHERKEDSILLITSVMLPVDPRCGKQKSSHGPASATVPLTVHPL
ncbi:hypothetical protein HDA40_000775 [Hamadaea flava]|nr:hypothetical protein [Hamadaea flava]